MQSIGGGHEIPWPEPLSVGDFISHKDYRMNDFPRKSDGLPWCDIPDDQYLSWLADYLPDNLPKLTGEQQKIFQKIESCDHLSGFRIGDSAGWYEAEASFRPNYEFPVDFIRSGDIAAVKGVEAGYTYEEYVEANEDILDPGERLMTPEELILEEFGWHLVLEEEQNQFNLYWPDFVKLDSFNIVFSTNTLRHEPPDAGWRVYLGMALLKMKDKEARIKELENFYHYWHEMLS